MPSFNRLLVLAVLALSASVQSAPVGDAAATDLSNVNGATEPSVVPAPVADFDDEEATEDLDARDFDQEDEDPEEDDEDLKTRDFEDEDEDEDEDLEARDIDEEDADIDDDDDDAESSTLERRARKKTTPKVPKASKPKVPKVPKAKTTKAPKPKVTKAPKPKTTKVKTTAKPKATKPAKTTKAKTTKPAKTTKAKTTKPAKTTKTKATKPAKTSKASKTTKASGTAKPSACPIKKPTKPTKKPRMFARAFDYVAHLFARDNEEFIGWHGTNSDTAAFWESKGQLEKPVKADGVLDFLGLGPKGTTAGTSGADAEIGPGVYVTDDQDIAIAFANNNAKVNKDTTAQLCAIFAKSSSNWRTALRKAFIPETLVGDSSNAAKKKQLEDARIAHIKTAVPGVSATSVVKFSLLNRNTHSGQLVLPATITNQFLAKCFKADGGATAPGTSKFPAFSYNGATLRSQWNIAAETAGECA